MPRRSNRGQTEGIVTFHAGLEKPACIKADGDGGWEVKLTVPDSESAAMLELASIRGEEIIVSIIPRRLVRQT